MRRLRASLTKTAHGLSPFSARYFVLPSDGAIFAIGETNPTASLRGLLKLNIDSVPATSRDSGVVQEGAVVNVTQVQSLYSQSSTIAPPSFCGVQSKLFFQAQATAQQLEVRSMNLANFSSSAVQLDSGVVIYGPVPFNLTAVTWAEYFQNGSARSLEGAFRL